MFTAWYAELESERLNVDVSLALFVDAERALVSARDHQILEALSILRAPVVLAQGVQAGDAEGGRQALRAELRGIDPRNLSGEGRLAFRRARRLASRGLTSAGPPLRDAG
jgi:hypothetical protein